MLYIEGFTFKFLKDELSDNLNRRKVSRVVQHDKFSLSLYFGKINLFLSINPQMPICYIVEDKIEAPDSPMNFALSLRKFLLGSILQKIEQIGYDRILVFHFTKLNELGENREYKLVVELMGKHSNVILLDSEDKILDLLKRFSLEESRLRLLMPHAPYEIPVIQEKIHPDKVDEKLFLELQRKHSLNNSLEGFGKISLNEINNYSDFQRILNSKPSPVIYSKNGKIKLASFIEYQSYSDYDKQNFDTVLELMNFYVKTTISSEHVENLKRTILKSVETKIKRNKSILKNIKKDVLQNGDFEKYKQTADILAANLYTIKSYTEKVNLFDFYENIYRDIHLEPKFSPQQNLDKYYKKYNKLKRGYEFNLERTEFIKKEIEYLESLVNYLENSSDVISLKNIEEELIEGKYIQKRKEKNKKLKRRNVVEVAKKEIDGFEILYGKNNKENEQITFKIADRDDIWFHIKDLPGSHVIIKAKPQQEIPESVLMEAAKLAVKFSKLAPDSMVTVDYTLRKYVKKPAKSKPGFVIYSHEKAINLRTE